MENDDLDCPYCGHPYSEEFLEEMIGKSFKCEGCVKKIYVKTHRGFIRPEKRLNRMAYYNKAVSEIENHKYIDKQVVHFIKQSAKKYNEDLKKQFFTRGKINWVREARELLFQWCDSIDIPKKHIISFFKKNNGSLDARTIKLYLYGKKN